LNSEIIVLIIGATIAFLHVGVPFQSSSARAAYNVILELWRVSIPITAASENLLSLQIPQVVARFLGSRAKAPSTIRFHMDESREFSAVFLPNSVICLPNSADRLQFWSLNSGGAPSF
jgi:hypothetical protein